jgi:hypothetical protein
MIGHMEKQIPGVQERYNQLSEFAHPNWSGVLGLYSVTDRSAYITTFGRGLRRTPSAAKEQAAMTLCAFLELFEHAYNSISDNLPGYLEELEPF